MQARVRPLHSYGSESFIVRWIDFNSSSKLCFEEKSNSVIYDKIFQKIRYLIFSNVVMVSMAKCPIVQSLQRVLKIPSFEPKFLRESENQCVLKSVKKVQNTTLERWVFKEVKIKPISSKAIYTCFHPNQGHCAITSLGETLQRFECEIVSV